MNNETKNERKAHLIVKVDSLKDGSDTLINREWVEAPLFMVVDRDTGNVIDSGYRSHCEAAKAWPQAVNARIERQPLHQTPQWVKTRNLDAETVAEFTFELYPISGMFESHADFTFFVLDMVQEFQERYKDHSWDDSDYTLAVSKACQRIIQDMRWVP